MDNSWDELEVQRMRLLEAVSHLSELAPYPVPRVEDVWRRLRATVTIFHNELVPHLKAVEELGLPILAEAEQTDLVGGMARIARRDIEYRLREIGRVESEVLVHGLTPEHILEAVRELAALSALARVLLGFGDEVVFPQLRASLSDHDLQRLSDAVLAYEHSLAAAS
jgi:hypothetical protein